MPRHFAKLLLLATCLAAATSAHAADKVPSDDRFMTTKFVPVTP